MSPPSITIREVAKRADVSTTTVSHVINKTRHVSEELTERVIDAMRELNYSPNSIARGLRLGNTRSIGVLIPDNSNPFFSDLARLLEDVGFRNQYAVFFCNSDNVPEKELAYSKYLIERKVDGILFIGTGDDKESLSLILENNIPIVAVDRKFEDPRVDLVYVNNEEGGYKATSYLLDLGHERIACIAGPPDITPSSERVLGYKRALQEKAVKISDEYIVGGNFRPSGGQKAIEQLLKLEKKPTAIFASNDLMAVGAINALRSININVPLDVSVVGFDNASIISELSPTLTTIAQPFEDIANSAVELLIERIENQEDNPVRKIVVLDTELLVRESTAKCEKK